MITNLQISEHLDKLAMYYRMAQDSHRASAFAKSSGTIRNYDGLFASDYKNVSK
jgi:hypothetical protein